MPRIARLDTPGLLHHIMIVGIERGKIFDYDKDSEDSAEWLKILFRARDLLCYWTVVELGMSMVDVASRFGITSAAVSDSVQRGEKMAKREDYQL